MAKYKTLTALADAMKSGELSSSYHLVLDKGGTVATLDVEPDDALSDDDNDLRRDECAELFDCEEAFGREGAMRSALSALGIRSQWC